MSLYDYLKELLWPKGFGDTKSIGNTMPGVRVTKLLNDEEREDFIKRSPDYRHLLNILRGDKEKLKRLLDYEFSQEPGITKQKAIEKAIIRLEWGDNRAIS